MIQDVYLVVRPGADRVYVSSSYPEALSRMDGARVFNVRVGLPGVEKVDGVLQLIAEEVHVQEVR